MRTYRQDSVVAFGGVVKIVEGQTSMEQWQDACYPECLQQTQWGHRVVSDDVVAVVKLDGKHCHGDECDTTLQGNVDVPDERAAGNEWVSDNHK